MRFKEFSESLADVEKDPSVKLYRMLTQPFGSTDSTSTPDSTVSSPTSDSPSSSVGTTTTSISGKEPAFKEPGFKDALNTVASNLGVDPNHLLQIMKRESNIDPHRVNPNGGATGLIQFVPRTARNLGTTTHELGRMTAVQQLAYVEKYYKGLGVKPGASVDDLS